ncbi:hypothetical protein ADL02_46225, partial [Streptomyces sp. NRRL WC-3723]
EREILIDRAGDIAAATGARTLIELGSGSSEKTRILLVLAPAAGLKRGSRNGPGPLVDGQRRPFRTVAERGH